MSKLFGLLICVAVGYQTAAAQITINPAQTYQTIEGFGASDCWTGNYVGKYWDEDVKEAIAQYLFSQNLKSDGSPKGIGLSMWRFNLGAGTMEQGDASDISDISRRAECMLDESGNYDFTKQSGQQWFLQKAKAYGCANFTAFSNAPLTVWSRNGKGYSNGDGKANLQEDKYDDFADYMATVIEHFIREGIPFRYISPVNEPQWDWKDPTQEGSPWENSEIKHLVTELDKAITAKQLPVQILLSEAGEWDYLYTSKGRASNQIYDFFDPNSADYIGNLPSLPSMIGGHSYWTYDTDNELQTFRENVKKSADNYGLSVFQTEWSMLSAGENFPSFENASYIDIALLMAKLIHSDLVYTSVSSWSYWTSMDMERWGQKNRFLLISLLPGGDAYNPVTETGTIKDMPTLWALGNYSFFIRPGYKRIELSGASDLQGLMGSAYLSPDNKRIVAVYVNWLNETKKITTDFVNSQSKQPARSYMYTTNSLYSLRKMPNVPEIYDANYQMSIPSRSVTTIIYDFDESVANEPIPTESFRIFPNPVAKGKTINITLPDKISDNSSLMIYTTDGKLLFSKKLCHFSATKQILLPPNIGKGIYLVKIQSINKLYCSKLIID